MREFISIMDMVPSEQGSLRYYCKQFVSLLNGYFFLLLSPSTYMAGLNSTKSDNTNIDMFAMDLESQFRHVLIYICFNLTPITSLFRSHLLRASCTFSTVSRSHNSHNNTHIGCWTKNRGFSPKMDGLYWKTLLKFMIWGYPYLWKHPYSTIQSWPTSRFMHPGIFWRYQGSPMNQILQQHWRRSVTCNLGGSWWWEPSCGSTLLSRHGWRSMKIMEGSLE